MIEADVLYDELNKNKNKPLSIKEIEKATEMSPSQIANGIKVLMLKKKIKHVKIGAEFSYQSI